MITMNKQQSKMFVLFGWALVVLSIVWNTETGLVCMVSYFLFVLSFSFKWKAIFVNAFLFFASFFSSYILVCAYNKSLGGYAPVIKDFMYPFFSTEYVIDDLEIKILPGVHTSALCVLF